MFWFIVACLLLGFLALLYFGQARLIYFPRDYSTYGEPLSEVESVEYLSAGKKQYFYLPKNSDLQSPERVWWLFGGNGSVALDWLSLVEGADPSFTQTYVLFDYPGYGENKGAPHPRRIRKSVDDAIPHVAQKLGLTEEELIQRSRAMGHSLGAAIAFDAAARYHMDMVVAISPFTSMQAMADRQLKKPLSFLLSHHYDNEKSVDQLIEAKPTPRMIFFHGKRDRLIPFYMGESLAKRAWKSGKVTFYPVTGAGHNDIVYSSQKMLIEILEDPE